MHRLVCAIWIGLIALPVFGETAAKYEVATIMAVKPHQIASGTPAPDVVTYDVSVKVADTVYVVLYPDTAGTKTVLYTPGRQLLVHVGKSTITYNDILGRSQDLPIISQKPAINAKLSK